MPSTEDLMAAFRTVLDERLAPIEARFADNPANSATPAGNLAATPATSQPTVESVENGVADENLARAVRAERALAEAIMTRSHRVGNGATSIPRRGPLATRAMNDLVTRARESAPTLSAVSADLIPELSKPAGRTNAPNFEDALSAILEAAEMDGFITAPENRSSW